MHTLTGSTTHKEAGKGVIKATIFCTVPLNCLSSFLTAAQGFRLVRSQVFWSNRQGSPAIAEWWGLLLRELKSVSVNRLALRTSAYFILGENVLSNCDTTSVNP